MPRTAIRETSRHPSPAACADHTAQPATALYSANRRRKQCAVCARFQMRGNPIPQLFVSIVRWHFCLQPHHVDDAESECQAYAQNPGEIPHNNPLLEAVLKITAGVICRVVRCSKSSCTSLYIPVSALHTPCILPPRDIFPNSFLIGRMSVVFYALYRHCSTHHAIHPRGVSDDNGQENHRDPEHELQGAMAGG